MRVEAHFLPADYCGEVGSPRAQQHEFGALGASRYDAVMNPIRAARQAKSGNQPGDPDKAAQALLQLVESETPPTRLFLGDDALGLVDQKLKQMRLAIATWDTLSRSTSFGK